MNGQVRLCGEELCCSGGETCLEGRLEICINNAWGTVCNNLFTSDEANIVCDNLELTGGKCRSCLFVDLLTQNGCLLGTRVGSPQLIGNSFGLGSGPIFLDQLRCNTFHSNLLDCPRGVPLGATQCSHTQDVAMQCAGLYCVCMCQFIQREVL